MSKKKPEKISDTRFALISAVLTEHEELLPKLERRVDKLEADIQQAAINDLAFQSQRNNNQIYKLDVNDQRQDKELARIEDRLSELREDYISEMQSVDRRLRVLENKKPGVPPFHNQFIIALHFLPALILLSIGPLAYWLFPNSRSTTGWCGWVESLCILSVVVWLTGSFFGVCVGIDKLKEGDK